MVSIVVEEVIIELPSTCLDFLAIFYAIRLEPFPVYTVLDLVTRNQLGNAQLDYQYMNNFMSLICYCITMNLERACFTPNR